MSFSRRMSISNAQCDQDGIRSRGFGYPEVFSDFGVGPSLVLTEIDRLVEFLACEFQLSPLPCPDALESELVSLHVDGTMGSVLSQFWNVRARAGIVSAQEVELFVRPCGIRAACFVCRGHGSTFLCSVERPPSPSKLARMVTCHVHMVCIWYWLLQAY